jgi:uracil-DNA glycosylase
MIYRQQDILDSKCQVIVQQCNCVSKTAKGLSSDILNRFSHGDFYSKRTSPSTPGTIKLRGSPNKKQRWICAFFAQYNPGGPNDEKSPKGADSIKNRLSWFHKCLSRLITKTKNLKSVAFPYQIGCGLARGNWDDYHKLIKEWAIENSDIHVEIVSPDYTVDIMSDGEFNEIDSKSDSDSSESERDSDSDDTRATYKNMTLLEFTRKLLKTNNNFKTWKPFIQSMIDNGELGKISDRLKTFANDDIEVYPPLNLVFQAFMSLSVKTLKAIILGQDPYHTPGCANGLCFSTSIGAPPPSLKNIFTELKNDGYMPNKTGDLLKWAHEGVFLINTTLTVEKGKANSHEKIWDKFSKGLFTFLSKTCKECVIIAWGGPAKNRIKGFNDRENCILTCPHPSPLSVTGFWDNHHFSKANKYLKSKNKKPIDWNLE